MLKKWAELHMMSTDIYLGMPLRVADSGECLKMVKYCIAVDYSSWVGNENKFLYILVLEEKWIRELKECVVAGVILQSISF